MFQIFRYIKISNSVQLVILEQFLTSFLFSVDDVEDLTMKDGRRNTIRTEEHFEEFDYSNEPASLLETEGSSAAYIDIKQKCIQESELSFRCIVCRRTYSNFGNFQRHYTTAHMPDKRMFPCPMCQREFTRKDNMQAHVRYTHAEPQLP
jgi:hypothetical protein